MPLFIDRCKCLLQQFLRQRDLSFSTFRRLFAETLISVLCDSDVKTNFLLQLCLPLLHSPSRLFLNDICNKDEYICGAEAIWNISILFLMQCVRKSCRGEQKPRIRLDIDTYAELLIAVDRIRHLGIALSEQAERVVSHMHKENVFSITLPTQSHQSSKRRQRIQRDLCDDEMMQIQATGLRFILSEDVPYRMKIHHTTPLYERKARIETVISTEDYFHIEQNKRQFNLTDDVLQEEEEFRDMVSNEGVGHIDCSLLPHADDHGTSLRTTINIDSEFEDNSFSSLNRIALDIPDKQYLHRDEYGLAETAPMAILLNEENALSSNTLSILEQLEKETMTILRKAGKKRAKTTKSKDVSKEWQSKEVTVESGEERVILKLGTDDEGKPLTNKREKKREGISRKKRNVSAGHVDRLKFLEALEAFADEELLRLS